MHFLVFVLNALREWYWWKSYIPLWRFECTNNLYMHIYVGREWWDMGMDTVQPTFQLSSTCCAYWEEDYLYAWWDREVYKFCGTDRKAWKAYHDGCWVYNFNGPSMVCSNSIHRFISHPMFIFSSPQSICLYRSDPTENDSIEGLRPNARGPGLVTFGVCFLLLTAHLWNGFVNLNFCICMAVHLQFLDFVGI